MRHPDFGEGTARIVVDRAPGLDLEAPEVEAPELDPLPEPPAMLPTKDGVGVLTGRITEEASGAAVGGARVSIPSLEMGAISNVEGKYLIFNVQPGTHTLLVEKEGFTSTEVEVVIAAGETTSADPIIRR
jgi:hypothetical protein